MTSPSAAGSSVNMVDCSNTRCSQERRLFKKELLTWSKKIPLIVGLEMVAEELLGQEVTTDLLQPYNNLETDDLTDWEPATKCCFCEAETKFMLDAVRQNMDDDSNKQSSESSNSDTPAIRYLQQLLPFAYPPSILPELPLTHDDGKPLDLSASSQSKKTPGDETEVSDQTSKPSVELKVPQIMKSGKRKELNGKKTYTEEELAAAVSDIRSGKLGTRRAAVLYGIPRSTLRNKIFKLESEQNQANAENGKVLENKLSMVDLLQGIPNGDFPNTGYGFSEESLLSNKFLNFSGEEIWEQKLDQIRRKHNLLEPDRKFGMPPMHFSSNHHLSDFEKSYFGSPFGSDLQLAFLPDLVRKMAEERMEMERQHHQSWQSLQLDLRLNNRGMHGLGPNGGLNNNNANVELKIPSYKPVRTTYMNGFGSNSSNHLPHHHDSTDHERSSDRSQRQSSNGGMTPKIGDTLKDIIAKTIAEKMRTRAMMNNTMHQLNINSNLGCQTSNPGPLSSDSSSMSSNDMGPSSEKRARLSPKEGSNIDSDQKDGSDGKNGKKTRPKRGQYRKYNSQLLLEAVRAVQRGEMSVHRAGSYFGVPHSTLEYKVKERHLLRHKKPREGRKKEGDLASPAPSAAPAPTTPTSQCSSRSETPVSLSPPLPTNSAMSVISSLAHQARDPSLSSSLGRMNNSLLGLGAWSSPPNNGNMSLLPTDPSMSAYPAGFALNTSASELLKKLQRKVQAKAAMAETGSSEEMAAALRAAAAMAAAASSVVSTTSTSSSPPPPPPSSNQGNTSSTTEATRVAAQ